MEQLGPRELDVERVQRLIGFDPHAKQIEILGGRERFTVIAGGKRVGKTMLVAYLALIDLLTSNKNLWIVGPTYDLAKRSWDYLEFWSNKYFAGLLNTYRAPEPIITSVFGSKLELKSAENEKSLLGKPLDGLILDEASRMNPEIWERYLRPNLIDRRGWAVMISNPFGKNWFYDQSLLARSDPEYAYFHVPTAVEDATGRIIRSNNPDYVPIFELERIKATTPEHIWKQEYLAEFMEGAGQVFRNIKRNAIGSLKAPVPGHLYYVGVDLGRLHSFTVVSVIDRSTRELVYFDRFKDVEWNLQHIRIVAVARRYYDAVVVVDSTGVGDPIIDMLRNSSAAVEEFRYTAISKQNIINKLARLIERGDIRYPEIPELIDELESFSFEKAERSDTVRYFAPKGRFDDCVHSLALACWLLDEESAVLPSDSRPELWYARNKTYD